MTHDELLETIDFLPLDGLHAWMQPALRAVVEILKDYNDGQVRVNQEFNQGVLALSNVIKDAIEEQLK